MRRWYAWCPGCSNIQRPAHTHYVCRRPPPRWVSDLSRKEVLGEGNETWWICGSIRFETEESMAERVRLYRLAYKIVAA